MRRQSEILGMKTKMIDVDDVAPESVINAVRAIPRVTKFVATDDMMRRMVVDDDTIMNS